MEANTCKKAGFRMPNYVLSKAATPMNSHFERTMVTSKFCANFAMQNPFKVQSTHPDKSWYQFIQHFTLKEGCTAKSTPAFDENLQFSNYAAWQTQHFVFCTHIDLFDEKNKRKFW